LSWWKINVEQSQLQMRFLLHHLVFNNDFITTAQGKGKTKPFAFDATYGKEYVSDARASAALTLCWTAQRKLKCINKAHKIL
jgi:hypothetical protein